MTTSDYIAIAGATISGLAAIAAIASGAKARSDAQKANRSAAAAQAEANRMATEAARLQALDWTSQYFSDVRIWGSEATDAISDLIHLALIRDDTTRQEKWFATRAKISALIDRGRWHFPNERAETFGLDKPPAYRGSRQRILDCLIWAYDIYKTPPVFFDAASDTPDSLHPDAYSDLVNIQREFVSEVQRVLNPREREKRVGELLERFGEADSMRDPSDCNRPKPKG